MTSLPIAIFVRLAALLGLTMVTWIGASAHEVRPAYLQLTETAPGTFDVLFKTPMQGDLRLALGVEFSEAVATVTPIVSRRTDDAMVQTWQVRSMAGLAGGTVRVIGLENTLSDALLRVDFVAGGSFTQRLTPASPAAIVPAPATGSGVAVTYLSLGVEHILTGVDHLLFVLGLILLTSGTRKLVLAITAFTFAHSITLAAAALGYVHVPPKPVEAVIALSIAFVALEIVRGRDGHPGIAAQAPWIAAFGFGLLHGFGFAGALSETGLPPGHIPTALLFFNVGVEAGQLLFVAAVLTVTYGIRRHWRVPSWVRLVPPYAIGSMAMFWVFQRVAAF